MNLEHDQWYIPDWDEWFMGMVYHVAAKSKDRSSKVGAIIVDDNRQIVKIGYNGFPIKVNDAVEKRHVRPDKYLYVSHAEANAVFFAARCGAKTEGCDLYTNGLCCVDCANAVIQSGIKKVIYHKQYQDKWDEFRRDKWDRHKEITLEKFNESGVEIVVFDKILNVKAMINGNIIEL